MAYRDILVRMDGEPWQHGPARFAADLAAKFGAKLVGAYARTQVPPPFMPADVVAMLSAEEIRRVYDAHEKGVAAAAEQARGAFEAAAAAEEVASEWRVVEDAEALIACARRTDLTVLCAEAGKAVGALTPVSLVLAAGGPAILLPAGATPSKLQRILVAWNGSREAARALHAAWPIIGLADEVDVLIVSRGGARGPEGLLQRHFENHAVRPNVIEDDGDDAAAGKVLRRHVETRAPDLVVMGLYGRTRIQELVLGGASREMLDGPTAPLLVHH